MRADSFMDFALINPLLNKQIKLMKLMNLKGSHVLLLLFLTNLLFLSCSDEKDILKLDAESLKQTSWGGQHIES